MSGPKEIVHYNQAKKLIEHTFSEFNSGIIISNVALAKEFGDMLASIEHIDREKWKSKKGDLHDRADTFRWIKSHLKLWDFHVLEAIYDWMEKAHKSKEEDHIYKYELEVSLRMLFHQERIHCPALPSSRLAEFERIGYRCLTDGPSPGGVYDALQYYFRKKELKTTLLHYIHDHKPVCNLRDICDESSDWRGYVMSTHFGAPFILYGAALKFHAVIHVFSLAGPHIEEIRFHPEDRKLVHSHAFIGHVSGQYYTALVPCDHIDSSSLPKEKLTMKRESSEMENYSEKVEKLEHQNVELQRTMTELQERMVELLTKCSRLEKEKTEVTQELHQATAQIGGLRDHLEMEKKKVDKLKVELEDRELQHKRELEEEKQRHKMALLKIEAAHKEK